MLIGSSDFEEKKLIDEEDWVNLSVVMHGAGNGLGTSPPFHAELPL